MVDMIVHMVSKLCNEEVCTQDVLAMLVILDDKSVRIADNLIR